jgi:hypothetical protein
MPSIDSLPWSSSGAGVYTVSQNLSGSDLLFDVQDDNVTIDLNGKTITRTNTTEESGDWFRNGRTNTVFTDSVGTGKVTGLHETTMQVGGTNFILDGVTFECTWKATGSGTFLYFFEGDGLGSIHSIPPKTYGSEIKNCTFIFDNDAYDPSLQSWAFKVDGHWFHDNLVRFKNWLPSNTDYRCRVFQGDQYLLDNCTFIAESSTNYIEWLAGWSDQDIWVRRCTFDHASRRGRMIGMDSGCDEWVIEDCNFLIRSPSIISGPVYAFRARWNGGGALPPTSNAKFRYNRVEVLPGVPSGGVVAHAMGDQNGTDDIEVDHNVYISASNQTLYTSKEGNVTNAFFECNDVEGWQGTIIDEAGGTTVQNNSHQSEQPDPTCWLEAGIRGGPTITVAQDYLIQSVVTDTVDQDYLIQSVVTDTVDQDYLIQSVVTTTIGQDFVVQAAIATKTVAQDYLIQSVVTDAAAQDFVIQSATTKTIGQDFVIQSVVTSDVAQDFVVQSVASPVKTSTISQDYLIQSVVTAGVGQDFVIQAESGIRTKTVAQDYIINAFAEGFPSFDVPDRD